MALEGGGGLNQPREVEIATIQLIEGGEHAQANGSAASEATRRGDQTANDETVRFRGQSTGFVVGLDNFGGKGIRNFWKARFDGDVVIEIESETEGIEAWAEVGGGGGDADPKRKVEVG